MNKVFQSLQSLKEKHPDKYPARIGSPWSENEEKQLLQEIQKKVPFEMIAELHERTEGGIRSRLREIAANYYFNNNLSVSEIQKFTGLSVDQISDAISRRQNRVEKKEQKKTKEKQKILIKDSPVFQEPKKEETPVSDTKEIISLLKDIKVLLTKFLEKVEYEE